ncbi:MAG: tetratricopeptide repeat protein [Planctomycetes bacterium]|nr:tetratricopeptide repeat protein [Planctomycetota bacterium]
MNAGRSPKERCAPRRTRPAARGLLCLLLALGGGLQAQEDSARFPPLSSAQMTALKEALRLGQEGRLEEAARVLESRTAELDHPAIHFELGNLRLRLRQPTAAIAAYRRALDRMPDHPESLRNLARALLEAGDPAQAVVPLTRALRRDELSLDWVKTLARLHLEDRRDVDTALAVYRRALVLWPDDAELRVGIIVAELRRRDLGAAVRTAEQALERFPFHPRITTLLADALVQQRDWGGAADLLEMLRLLGRAGSRELRALADLYHHEGLHAAAAEVYREVAARAGEPDPEVELRLADSLQHSGQNAAAAEVLEALLAHLPEDGRVWLRLGWLRQAEGKADGAKRALEEAARRLAESGEAHLGLAAIHLEEDRLDEAEAAYLRAAGDPATAARAWKGLGAVAVRRGNTELAIRNYRHALALDPEDREALRLLSRLERRR